MGAGTDAEADAEVGAEADARVSFVVKFMLGWQEDIKLREAGRCLVFLGASGLGGRMAAIPGSGGATSGGQKPAICLYDVAKLTSLASTA